MNLSLKLVFVQYLSTENPDSLPTAQECLPVISENVLRIVLDHMAQPTTMTQVIKSDLVLGVRETTMLVLLQNLSGEVGTKMQQDLFWLIKDLKEKVSPFGILK